MSILKELCTKEIEDPNVKTTYQYVLDLKERLQSMAQLARENLEKSATRYKKYYDKKARNRSLKVGDKALILMPTDNNKLLLQWKGPFEVLKKVNRVDYQLKMNGKVKTFHINLLKKYVERAQCNNVLFVTDGSVFGSINATFVDCVEDTTQEGQLDDYPALDSDQGTDVDINGLLSTEEREKLMSTIAKYGDVLQDQPGSTNILEHDIRMVSDKPIHVKTRSVPFSLEETVNKERHLNIISKYLTNFFSVYVVQV
ncbi:uncharacterized protein LOC133180739 [Saccostrea echinata]|uniref:uncharacterized protein LOC133180739 n=1 Tax=Saccostrea echinata TaxID=191078 RepID=UPI002A833C73|nr:uncharacterized protein LOC133180739 [Saccostrea echinata]